MNTNSSSPQAPLLTIKPSKGWVALNLKEIVQFKDLLFVLALRDIKLRYRQTALGPIWILLQPLLAAGVFTFIFSGIAKLTAPGNVPYFMFSFSGQLGWNLFASTVAKVGGSLTSSTHLVSKVYFPRLILPLSTIISVLVDFCAASLIMIAMMVILRHWGGAALLTLPLWILLLLMLATGIGLMTTAMTVSFRDVSTVVTVLMSFLMYISPVGYAYKDVPARLKFAYNLNPVAGLIEGFRWSLLGTGKPTSAHVIYAVTVVIAVFIAGLFTFKRMERSFADVI